MCGILMKESGVGSMICNLIKGSDDFSQVSHRFIRWDL